MKETIKTRVVPSDIAKLLKNIGYDEKINENYTYTHPWVKKGCVNVVGGYKEHYWSCTAYSNTEWETNMSAFAKALRFDGRHPPISAPSYAMVVDWLLKEYDYFVQVVRTGRNEYRFEVVSFCVEEGLRYSNNRTYTDRYSAMDVAFKYILRTIKNRHKSDILKEAIEFIEKEKTKKDGQAKND